MAHATSAQKDRIVSIVTALALKQLEASSLTEEGAARLIESEGELTVTLEAAIASALSWLSVSQEYADEQVPSNYGYLSGYTPRPLAEQLAVLRQLFPELGTIDQSLGNEPVPEGAEGWSAIPSWQKIAPTYNEALEKVLALLDQTRSGKFHNYRAGELGPDRLRQSPKSVAAFRKLESEQPGHDILVVGAQFGLSHRGQSVRRARAVMGGGEFGLGAFAIGIMLLTYPDRLQHYDDLWIDCAGDEYSYGADGVFEDAPCFRFVDGQLKFDADDVGHALDCYGSASGFAPQSVEPRV